MALFEPPGDPDTAARQWQVEGVTIEPRQIVCALRTADGATATVRLEHPSRVADPPYSSVSFAITVAAADPASLAAAEDLVVVVQHNDPGRFWRSAAVESDPGPGDGEAGIPDRRGLIAAEAGLWLAWIGLLGFALAVALRRARATDRVALAVVLALGFGLRWAVPMVPGNWYLHCIDPAASGAFCLPVSLLRAPYLLVGSVLGEGSDGVFAMNRVAGAVGPALFLMAFVVGVPSERGHPNVGRAWALMMCAYPLWVRSSSGDGPQALAICLAGAAALALAWPATTRARASASGALAAVSVALGCLARPELVVAFATIPCLVIAAGSPARRVLRRAAAAIPIGVLVAAIVYASWELPLLDRIPGALAIDAATRASSLFRFSAGLPVGVPPVSVGSLWALAFPGWIAVAALVGRRRPGQAVAMFGAWILPAIPVWMSGWATEDLVNGRYSLLVVPGTTLAAALGFGAVAKAVAATAKRATAHRIAVGLAVVLSLLWGALWTWHAVPVLRVRYVFQAEYEFLRAGLGEVPDGCRVVALFEPGTGLVVEDGAHFDFGLALPHTLLQWDRPDLVFDVWAFSATDAPRSPDPDECVVVYRGAFCSLPEPGPSAMPWWPESQAVHSAIRRSCDALDAFAVGADLVARDVALSPGFANYMLGDETLRLRLSRVAVDQAGSGRDFGGGRRASE